MANTTVIKGNMVQVTGLDADWNSVTDTPFKDGMKLLAIVFDPSAIGDVMVVEEESDGPRIFYASCTDTHDQRIQYYDGTWHKPYIDISDCTLDTAANARVLFLLA